MHAEEVGDRGKEIFLEYFLGALCNGMQGSKYHQAILFGD
jgi:hypothetical protein